MRVGCDIRGLTPIPDRLVMAADCVAVAMAEKKKSAGAQAFEDALMHDAVGADLQIYFARLVDDGQFAVVAGDAAGVALVGLTLGSAVSSPTAYQVLIQETACPERFPRRVGIPAKRPLFPSHP